MTAGQRPFHYGPDALLRQTRWELQLLAADAQRARQLLDSLQLPLRETRAAVAAAEDALRTLYGAPGGISLDQRALLQAWLDYSRDLAVAQQQQVAQAEARYEQVLAQLHAKRVSLRTMELHRERRFVAHVADELTRELCTADEQWLLRPRRKRVPVLPFPAGGGRGVGVRTSGLPAGAARVIDLAARIRRVGRETAPDAP